MRMEPMKSLESSIRATIEYFDIFDHPLTLDEIRRHLFAFYTDDIKEVAQAITRIEDVKMVGPYYVLNGRDEIAKMRRTRLILEEKLWFKVRDYRWLFRVLPFIKLVGVVNSLAYGNVNEQSDIDLFVVVEKGRLGSARFFMKLFTHILGIRVHHKKKSRRFCLSFFVTEDALNLSKLAHKFDPYLAYFVRTMAPVFGSKKTYVDFLKANEEWVGPYGVYSPRLERFVEFEKENESNKSEWYTRKVEAFLYKYQHERDFKRVGENPGVVMNEQIFKSNEVDRRVEFAQRFEERLNKIRQ